jgi:hypothetical protein
MKRIFTAAFLVAMVVLMLAPNQLFASGDTLYVYASITTPLDKTIRGDTLANGAQAHHWYKLPTTDTTYIFDAAITAKENFAVIGIPNPSTGKLPCIQPDVLSGGAIPGSLFVLSGQGTQGTFKNLYLLDISINNTIDYAGGFGIALSADSIRLVVDNVVFEQWSQFAISYAGNWDKFYITNCKFRNMTTQPTQYYVGEVLRNRNDIGAFKTDTIIMRYNTMICVSGYATAATGGIVNYYEFSHNNVVWTFKNLFFLDRMVNAKFDNNIFYGVYTGGQARNEFSGGWDSFTAGTVASIITMGPLDSTTAAILLGHASTGAGDPAAELLRKVEVKNNVYFWPSSVTSFWTSWNDTATVDSIYTPVFMNAQSVGLFSDATGHPGFVQSGNQNVDPGFGATIPAVFTQATNGLKDWFTAVRGGSGTTQLYGYQNTQVATSGIWTPPWPLPETADMKYTNASLKTGGTDGRPIGDPWWFNGTNGGSTGVVAQTAPVPHGFSLSEAYPNPFNPTTNIDYTLNKAGVTSLKVYNILGQVVSTLVDNAYQNAGSYKVNVDMSHATSGVYFYILEQGGNRIAHKMLLLK